MFSRSFRSVFIGSLVRRSHSICTIVSSHTSSSAAATAAPACLFVCFPGIIILFTLAGFARLFLRACVFVCWLVCRHTTPMRFYSFQCLSRTDKYSHLYPQSYPQNGNARQHRQHHHHQHHRRRRRQLRIERGEDGKDGKGFISEECYVFVFVLVCLRSIELTHYCWHTNIYVHVPIISVSFRSNKSLFPKRIRCERFAHHQHSFDTLFAHCTNNGKPTSTPTHTQTFARTQNEHKYLHARKVSTH